MCVRGYMQNATSGASRWCNSLQARLANFHEWKKLGTLLFPLRSLMVRVLDCSRRVILFEHQWVLCPIVHIFSFNIHSINKHKSCPWCNGYRRRKGTQRHEFKSWKKLIAFHIALIHLGKVWIHLFFLELWVNSRTDWVLQPWWGN